MTPGIICVLLSLAAGAVSAQDSPGEARLLARRTALLIENFTRYIDWPADALPEQGAFVLCLQGQGDTARELAALAASYRFKKRRTEVRHIQPGDAVAACHVLYLAPSERARLRQAVAAADGKPILTVGDSPGFAAEGVHLNVSWAKRALPKPGTYPQFEWSVPAVRRSVLLIAPDLLSQGNEVHASAPAPTRGTERP